MRVLIVDDSVVFRSQIKAALSGSPQLEVVGTAANGKLALQKLEQTPVDLVTLDYEMPEMNGLDTLKEIRKRGYKTRVIVFSSQTPRGATLALNALRAGADDIVPKPEGSVGADLSTVSGAISLELLPKILQFESAGQYIIPVPVEPVSKPSGPVTEKKNLANFFPDALFIGSSTGGPKALEIIFTNLKGPFRVPVFITQHMPPVFTACLASRIGEVCGVEAKEGVHNEKVVPNRIYMAPGNFHMTLAKVENDIRIKLDQSVQVNSVRPAVDPLFSTGAQIYGAKSMGIVLTGMGEDGCIGAQEMRRLGGRIMIQNKESCVVFGMPGAIHSKDAFDGMGDLQMISQMVGRMVKV